METKRGSGFYAGSRYAHDMEQAEAMRRSQRRLGGNARPETTTSSEAKRLTLEDIESAFRGLAEAESQRDSGNYQIALKLYQLSLEVLLLFLKDGDNFNRIPVDPSTVSNAVSAALSDAEELKAQSPKSAASSAAQSPMVSRMISSLSAALSGRSQKAAAVPGTGSAMGFQEVAISNPVPSVSQASARRISKIPRSSIPKVQNGPLQPPGQTTQQTELKLGDPVKSKLYTAVLDELYVPPESIQDTSWDDIAGLEDVKQSLQESAILPLIRPDLFTGLRKSQNILLWGPPGTGKTMLVRAVAKESGSSLFACSPSSLTSKWMGEAEKLVKALFQVAKEVAPSLIFLDEVDALLSNRKSDGEHEASRRLKTEFMVQMEGIGSSENRVLVLACTNCPWDVDSAVLRRFPRRIFVPLPDAAARDALLKNILAKAGKHSIKNKAQRDKLVKRLEGFSCSDITAIASEASFGPIRSLGSLTAIKGAKEKDVRPINSGDFEEAIRKATKSISETQLEKFEIWRHDQSAN